MFFTILILDTFCMEYTNHTDSRKLDKFTKVRSPIELIIFGRRTLAFLKSPKKTKIKYLAMTSFCIKFSVKVK